MTDALREQKIKAIKEIVDTSIKSFVDGFEWRYEQEVTLDTGVINQKKNNVFISELGEEFMFYSAFVRSFDSSFGKQLERIGNSIAKLSYDVRDGIESYILPQQKQHIDYLMTDYDNKEKPTVEDYSDFNSVQPKNTRSYEFKHETDNYFFDEQSKTHFIIELKAGGDLDIKKAKSEKVALLNEYFLLKNKLRHTDEKVAIKFATAYNKFGEGNEWKQNQVRRYFAVDELLIGRAYWDFVCNETNGFEIVFGQYKESANYIKEALERIKQMYF